MFWKLAVAIAVVAGLGGVVYLSGVSSAQVKEAWKSLSGGGSAAHEDERATEGRTREHEPAPPWDGLVTVTKDQEASIGLHLVEAAAQTEPIKLELTGRTAYDPDTLTRIRPRFDTLVVDVHAKLGDKVKAGAPVVELYSTELAQAKSDFQIKYVQWQHDKKLYDLRQKLVETGAIANQLWVDTQNDEQKSRLDYTLALDKLQVYEVPKEEIDPLLARLGDPKIDTRHFGDVSQKARMILRAKSEGIVIEREVVPGNFYQPDNVLMVIAPLDHLWVQVNVYELDQDKVAVGQTMEIQFPFLAERIRGRVEYVANEVSKDTRAVRVRATIPNHEGRLKSDMLVKAILDIPPREGQTFVPRLAMVAVGGEEFVFVKEPGRSADGPDRFARRPIVVAEEDSEHVIVTRGLKPGEEVVTNGSLILAQLFEDQQAVETGLPTR